MTQAVALAQQASTGVSQGFKNRIINGAMVLDQRNAGASVAFSSGTAFGADRFVCYNQTSGAYTVQQVADAPTGFKYSDKITTTSAGSTGTAGWTSFFQQRIEGYNIADLGAGTADAKTITLSFWVKSSLTGAMPVVFLNDADRLYATTYTINAANTWEQKTITLTLSTSGTWNSTNGRGLLVSWGLGSGSTYTTSTLNSWQNLDGLYFTSGAVAVGATLNATWQVTGVQLEVGSTATSFDYLDYGRSLIQCQRYFQSYGYGVNGTTGDSCIGTGMFYTSTELIVTAEFKVIMRAVPTYSSPTVTSGYRYHRAAANTSIDSIPYSGSTSTSAAIFGNVSLPTAGVAGYATQIYAQVSGAKINFSAEL
jgi:hypothetical protein